MFKLVAAASALSVMAWAQSPQCQATAVPPLIRAEGVAERLGDIVLSCTGTPNQIISGNLTVFLDVPITNKVLSGNNLDVVLTVNNQLSPNQARLQTTGSLAFNGLQFAIGANGFSEVRISNLRGNVSALSAGEINARLAFNPPSILSFSINRFSVGAINRGLLSTTLQTFIPNQLGSALPESLSFGELITAGTRFSSTRVTEGFATAFEPRAANSDNGVRIVIRLSGYPADARLFAQNAIAGANAQRPTIGGDFGGSISAGEYTSGSRTLFLVRVVGGDANGAGGSLVTNQIGASTPILNDVTEVQLTGGSGSIVYEVVDANPSIVESAQIPIFLGLPRTVEARTITTVRNVAFGPISTASGVSPSAPIPRFSGQNASSDCAVLRDCNSPFIPRLEVSARGFDFVVPVGSDFFNNYIPLTNTGGGLLPYNARIEYAAGATNWIRIFPASGSNGGTIRLDVLPFGLGVGTYDATLFIDAGQAGSATLPVRLRIVPLPPPLTTVTSAVNAASFGGSLVAGSLATIRGSALNGTNLAVTINGLPARILFANNEQINIQVPPGLTGATVQVVVTANGITSAPLIAPLAPVSPGIFVPGILNQDNSVNSPANPARIGSIVQIFATGLLTPEGAGSVDTRVHDVNYAAGSPSLIYAGSAPGIPGVQQVNQRLPDTLGTGTTDLVLCSTALGQRVCGPAVRISVTR